MAAGVSSQQLHQAAGCLYGCLWAEGPRLLLPTLLQPLRCLLLRQLLRCRVLRRLRHQQQGQQSSGICIRWCLLVLPPGSG